jgi:hypothetical protein
MKKNQQYLKMKTFADETPRRKPVSPIWPHLKTKAPPRNMHCEEGLILQYLSPVRG